MIREYIYRLKLKAQKRRAHFEILHDIAYIETFKAESLELDEAPLRVRMAELKRKEIKTPEEDQEFDNIIQKISESKAVKNEHTKSTQLLRDLENYISLL